jgi:thiamine pyrophosphate-dependent acetolactate synthase large subunit-like protein
MPLPAAIAALHAARRTDDVVITTMGAAREWLALGTGPLDFVFLPSSMGQATSVGLGLALARPERRIIVANGDGSMLMNLDPLVTIAAAAPANLAIIVLVNGVYEVTGAQPIPGAPTDRSPGTHLDFIAMARACGFRSVFRFSDLAAWTAELPTVLAAPGPVFAAVSVAPVPGAAGPRSPGPAAARARAFMAALRGRATELPPG